MHALTSVSLPEHDEKTEAVLLYSMEVWTVQANGKSKRLMRKVYKILRPGGRGYGTVIAYSSAEAKVLNMHGWCIPAQGKDFEVKDKDAVETSAPGVASGELVSDLRARILKIPEPEPGNIVGYEIEQEEYPYVLQDLWMFQSSVPVREAHYTLQLPPGWEYEAVWVNATEAKPNSDGNGQWQWVVNDIKGIRDEEEMPPWKGVAGQMIVSVIPPNGSRKGFVSWADVGKWTFTLAQGRRDASPEIRQKVTELTAGKATTLAKMQALANFVQRDIRYVAIELGIGGWQPHPAKDIYSHHYGDCKDKATLLSTMLKEAGMDSYYVAVNTFRGAVRADTPPQQYFNHMILGLRLPDDVQDASLESVYVHPKLGRILIFDPTDEMTPLGSLRGPLQGNYGLLVTPDGGDLIELPLLTPSSSGNRRIAKLQLSPEGTLSGDVTEIRQGDNAAYQRYTLRTATKDADRIKPIEALLSRSLGTFQITKATVGNLDIHDQPFEYIYSFSAGNYAKSAGNLLLVRPRVMGNWSSDILEKKDPRKYPVEFEGPLKNVDSIEIKLPAGYEVDELPPAADAEYSFANYHSRCVAKDGALQYTRTLELKELSVPVDKLSQLKSFYRIIASDERSTAVLKPKGN
ncbi:MAG TPA: DUF3857 domain-containing protein [Candidatus Acidoferrum sp.]|nr:DUF3857 domain-containing protein [Candidatus Acidoferrum sp.]